MTGRSRVDRPVVASAPCPTPTLPPYGRLRLRRRAVQADRSADGRRLLPLHALPAPHGRRLVVAGARRAGSSRSRRVPAPSGRGSRGRLREGVLSRAAARPCGAGRRTIPSSMSACASGPSTATRSPPQLPRLRRLRGRRSSRSPMTACAVRRAARPVGARRHAAGAGAWRAPAASRRRWTSATAGGCRVDSGVNRFFGAYEHHRARIVFGPVVRPGWPGRSRRWRSSGSFSSCSPGSQPTASTSSAIGLGAAMFRFTLDY